MNRRLPARRVFFAVIFLTCCVGVTSRTCSTPDSESLGGSQRSASSEAAQMGAHPDTTPDARNLAARSVDSYFEATLDSMERADFLVSPALLMQEAISKDAVITYPEN